MISCKLLTFVSVLVLLASAFVVLFDEQKLFSDAQHALECSICKTSLLTGTVDDCCIDFETVDRATKDFFVPLLTNLQRTTFFKYFKVDLSKPCPFWDEDGQCVMRDCAVCSCDPKEIPVKWLEEDKMKRTTAIRKITDSAAYLIGKSQEDKCKAQERMCADSESVEKELGRLDRSHSDPTADHFQTWDELSQPSRVWTEQEDEEMNMIYVNLELNPERFTGYSGASAWRVWKSIYMENCFDGFSGGKSECREKRVFFRLLSGLQSSITTQIANDYRFENGRYGPNVDFFTRAVGAHPDRLTNMYFAYLFLLRAIAKVSPLLKQYDYSTGNTLEDLKASQLVSSLVDRVMDDQQVSNTTGVIDFNADVVSKCLIGFNERGMFEVENNGRSIADEFYRQEVEEKLELKEQFVNKFQNISKIMDCVGCEKCKMWGKLETLGIGTAIKIILASESCEEIDFLSRNEVTALINTAAQLAKSVGTVPMWRKMEVNQLIGKILVYIACVWMAIFMLFKLVMRIKCKRREKVE